MQLQKPSVTSFLPPGKKGIAEVTHFTVSEQEASFTRMRAAFGHPAEEVDPGSYAKLCIHGSLMMTDTRFEWRSNAGAVYRAKGRVLIGGLGIGMVLAPILASPVVEEVTVVEKHQDVIDLVEPHVRKLPGGSKLKIICADILEWKPPRGARWDAIYFDIWQNICTDNLPEMNRLKRRFRNCKAPGGWMGCWEEDALRRRRGGY